MLVRWPRPIGDGMRLIYLEHVGGNLPIRQTIERINDPDRAEHERMIADGRNGGWRIAA